MLIGDMAAAPQRPAPVVHLDHDGQGTREIPLRVLDPQPHDEGPVDHHGLAAGERVLPAGGRVTPGLLEVGLEPDERADVIGRRQRRR